jgi:uncharacterized protein (TIGR03435 family)
MTQRLANKPSFSRKLLLAAFAAAALAGLAVFEVGYAPQIRAQSTPTTAAPLPSFEVASVKPDHAGGLSARMESSRGRFIVTNVTAKRLIAWAYSVKDFQVMGGPGWINSEAYDIDAKLEDADVEAAQSLPPEQRLVQIRLRVQALLADRFKLVVRHETKEVPLYALTIAKSGPKFQEAKPGDTYPNGVKGRDGRSYPGMIVVGRGQFTAQAVPMTPLVMMLSHELGRTVLDQTGLKDKYDITLKWTPDQRSPAMFMGTADAKPGTPNPPPPDSSGPSIFTALHEQLGLKLESTKGPVDVIVIDHIERPSEN